MQCPKCHAAFEEVELTDGIVDRCTGCRGLWFDNMEHEELKQHAAVLDDGSASKGAEYNAVDRISCPRCPGDNHMIRMVDPIQPHIWFESCSICYGRFYDAGEFRDFSELTFAEFFRRRPTQPRH